MPVKIYREHTCNICNDIWTGNNDDWTSCKCGINEVKEGIYSVSYRNRGDKNFTSGKAEVIYNPEDYLILDRRCEKLWNKIKNIDIPYPLVLSNHVFEDTDTSSNGDKFVSSLYACVDILNDYGESNDVTLTITLENTRKTVEEIYRKLLNYYVFLLRIKYQKVSMNNRGQLTDIFYNFETTQIERYNYEFYFQGDECERYQNE